jgi:hypothetical protein
MVFEYINVLSSKICVRLKYEAYIQILSSVNLYLVKFDR